MFFHFWQPFFIKDSMNASDMSLIEPIQQARGDVAAETELGVM
jgi:hypothetical protein